MPTLLVIEVSPRFDYSTSRKLTERFVAAWKAANPQGKVITRDLAKAPVPLVDFAWIGGAFMPADTHTAEMTAAIRVSDDLVAELKSADHLLIATPMFNFSIPAALKAWIDQIVRVGVTVGTDNKGLLSGKRADIILATGGDFTPGSPVAGYNLASGYLTQVLGWIGISDVNITLAGRSVAGGVGETAVEALGATVEAAATRAPASAAAM